MKIITRILLTGFMLSPVFLAAQSSCYQNPSMEGTSQAHVVPAPWQACYGSPDTQPGQWGITMPASNGNTYVSFLHAGNSPNGYSEGMTQLLTPCMVAGQTYSFTVDLAHSNVYNTASPGNCYSSLAVWGGATACARTQLLWTSGVITNTSWQQYTITFTPTSNWCYLSFEPYYITACSGYINLLMDNISCVAPVSSGINGQNVTCNGACNGMAWVTPTSGTPPYTYSWSPSPSTNDTIFNLCPGTYTCIVTDANSQTATNTITITQPPALTATQTQTNILCNGSCTGVTSVTASGGTGTLSYSWAPGGQTTSSVSGRCAGTYTCTITDANGCTITRTFNITQPPALTTTGSQTNILCNGQCTGSATVTASGGNGSYSYVWAPSGGNAATASNLCAGNYTCTVTDGNGCTTTRTFAITQPTALAATATPVAATCNGACDGSATVAPSGGTAPYSYAWAPAGGTGPTASNLCAGTYTCTITDANGCVLTSTCVITQPAAITATFTTVNSTCSQANGSATVNASGGTGAFTYSWSTTPVQTTQTASSLIAGPYTVTVTDANGCTGSFSVTVNDNASPTASISASTDASCFGTCDGTATGAAVGGTGAYTWSWNTTPVQTTQTATGLCAGSYTCTVTDANGCTSTSTVTISEPSVLSISSSSQTDILCFGGNTGDATVVATGGTPNYSYSWAPSGGSGSTGTSLIAGSYTCTVTDLNGCSTTQTFTLTEPPQLTLATAGFNATCNGACDGQVVVIPSGGVQPYSFAWNTGCSTPSCSNICAGTYSITVTDANGCTATDQTTVTEPTAITGTTGTITAHCSLPDGFAFVSASGGTGTLTYAWSTVPVQTTDTASTLAPGPYTVTITDANGCTASLTANVPDIPGVNASPGTVTNVSCFGVCDGSATVATAGGTQPYLYSWNTTPVQTTATATGLCAGAYVCTVTDSAGCVSSATMTVTQPAVLTVSPSAGTSICLGQNTQISASASGGTQAYSYNWDPGLLSGSTQTVSPAATQTYTVTVTDANGCTVSGQTTVTVNPVPVASFSSDLQSGCEPLTVQFTDISTVASPGTIVTWFWDFGDGTSTSQNPTHTYNTSGLYTVILTVTTTDGCTNTITLTNYINVYAMPVAEFAFGPQPTTVLEPTICFTDQSVNAASWNWSFGDFINSTSVLQNPCYAYGDTGCYPVVLTVTSSNGCVDTVVHPICIDPDYTMFIPNTFTPDGNGTNDIFIPVSYGMDISTFEMWIFDRWGNMIYYTDNLAKGWDGRVQGRPEIAQIDTYVYKIRCKDFKDIRHTYLGHVNLIR